MKKTSKITFILLLMSQWVLAAPVGSRFTYQGQMQYNGSPANGDYDFRFELFSNPTGGTFIGSPIFLEDIPVTNGLFSVELDFADVPYTGDDYYLKVQIREGSSSGGYTGIFPKQRINAVPYAVQAEFVEKGGIKAGTMIDCGVGLNGPSDRFFNLVNDNDFATADTGAGGNCIITMPFDVDEAFFLVNAAPAGGVAVFESLQASCSLHPIDNNKINCQINDQAGGVFNGKLQILIY